MALLGATTYSANDSKLMNRLAHFVLGKKLW